MVIIFRLGIFSVIWWVMLVNLVLVSSMWVLLWCSMKMRFVVFRWMFSVLSMLFVIGILKCVFIMVGVLGKSVVIVLLWFMFVSDSVLVRCCVCM